MDILKRIRSGDMNASINSSENIVVTCNMARVCVPVYAYGQQALTAEHGPHGGAQPSTGAHSRSFLSSLKGTNESIPSPPREKKLAHQTSSVESLARSIRPFLQRSVPLQQSISPSVVLACGVDSVLG
jgi:hypothetical protein